MILLINICKEKLHFYEFVKPIEDILKKEKIKFITKNYSEISNKEIINSSKIIICGTSLKDNKFLNNMKKFNWIKNYKKPILGICGGAHVIGLVLGYELKKKTEIGLKYMDLKKSFLGVKGKKQVYHLHQFYTFPKVFHKRNFYTTLFHPEVRNKEMILNFARL